MPGINLPIIDISNPHDPTVGKAMLDAAAKYGFLYVNSQSTDFAASDVKRAFDLSRQFFASPVEEKATCRITPDNRGWAGMQVETLDPENHETGDFKESMNITEFHDKNAQQPLPPSLSPHQADIYHFETLCRKTCNRILTLLALGLEIQPSFFTSPHDPIHGSSGSAQRYLYYPSIASPATVSYRHGKDVRAGAHSDYGSISLLFQRPGQPGLEILTPEGTWAPVAVEPDQAQSQSQQQEKEEEGSDYPFPPILVNIGDLLSYWTDGLLKSTVHRVVFPAPSDSEWTSDEKAQDRYSVVYFCHPVDNTELDPVPSEIVARHREECKRRGGRAGDSGKVGRGGGAGALEFGKKALTASEYLMSRLGATYGIGKKAEEGEK